MIIKGYALLRYSNSYREGESFSHVIAASADLEKITKLKNLLLVKECNSYPDRLEIEEIHQYFDEKEIINLLNEEKE